MSLVAEAPRQSLTCETPCEQVCLEVADNYKVWARLFETVGAKRAVLYLHGIQSHGGWFLRSCDHLRCEGMTVLIPDRRGSGLNRQDRGHCDSGKQLIADVDRSVQWLQRRSGLEQVDLVAISWSGKLALAYAARFAAKVRSVVLVTPGMRAKVDISLAEKIMIGAEGIINPHKQHEIPLNDPTLFTRTPTMLEFIEHDPLKLTHATASFFITSKVLDMAIPKVLRRLTMPVHLLLAEHDQIIDNDATLSLLRPVLTPVDEERRPAKLYENAQHTIEFEADPEAYFADLAACVKKGTVS